MEPPLTLLVTKAQPHLFMMFPVPVSLVDLPSATGAGTAAGTSSSSMFCLAVAAVVGAAAVVAVVAAAVRCSPLPVRGSSSSAPSAAPLGHGRRWQETNTDLGVALARGGRERTGKTSGGGGRPRCVPPGRSRANPTRLLKKLLYTMYKTCEREEKKILC